MHVIEPAPASRHLGVRCPARRELYLYVRARTRRKMWGFIRDRRVRVTAARRVYETRGDLQICHALQVCVTEISTDRFRQLACARNELMLLPAFGSAFGGVRQLQMHRQHVCLLTAPR